MNIFNKSKDELINELEELQNENRALKYAFSKDIHKNLNIDNTTLSRINLNDELDKNITFENLFEISQIQSLQDQFADATGVASLITNTDGVPITKPSNFTELCNDIIRKTEIGCANCYKSDSIIGKLNLDRPTIQPCLSGGLWDASASIIVGGRHIANWLIGQIRDETQTEDNMRKYAQEIGANEDIFIEAFNKVPSMSKSQFEKIANVLFTIANQISDSAYRNIQQSRLINELVKVEDSLRESEEKLRTFFSSMTEMVVLHELVFDDEGNAVDYRIIDCNKAFTEVTGITKEIAIGNLASKLYGIEEAPYLEEFSQVAITGIPYEYTDYFQPMDKYFAISVVSPKRNHFATVTTDITAVKQIQDVIAAKNKELENYLFVASHDLRSPLVNIQGFSRRLHKNVDSIKKIIDESSLEESAKENIEAIINQTIPKTLDFIYTNVNKMDTLINGLLQISRTGRIVMIVNQIDMNSLIKNVINSKEFQLTELSANVNIGELDDCYGDENLLNQLFSNLIANAINYRSPDRQLVLNIQSQNKFKKIIYSIEDNGTGIAERHLEKIWDVFFRASTAVTGEGLGLSIVKRIVDKHRGKIWVESKEGVGSTFFVELQKSDFSE